MAKALAFLAFQEYPLFHVLSFLFRVHVSFYSPFLASESPSEHRLHRRRLDVGAQVRVALRHLDGLVAHEALDRVQRGALNGEPGGEGVAQGVEDHAVLGIG